MDNARGRTVRWRAHAHGRSDLVGHARRPAARLNVDYRGAVANTNAEHFANHSDGSQRRVRLTINSEGDPVLPGDDRVIPTARRAAGGPVPPNELARMPVGSIALVLGYVAGSAQARRTPGRVCTLVDELRRRGVYPDILAALDPDLAQRIDLLYTADRGQVWRTGGQRPPR